ncbi:macro domain-containing protein [Bacillus pumilus]|uniref:macro domain-containing protein n=1 Tax=Bacillus pumilus TaxID=1408 RepID=UPI001C248B7F|nr:macro domain-containing protein [Bacillus pumilus]MBU8607895.1 macro domain-containing protein [Bacillus pumilus]
MIRIVERNILDTTKNIICHQVNCKGVMGAGLAKQIKSKYPNVFKDYKRLCENQNVKSGKSGLLGATQFVDVSGNKTIANLFAQDNYGVNKRQTDYDAMELCLKSLNSVVNTDYSKYKGCSIAIPYGIGCGLAGGDWKIVKQMIDNILGDCDVTIYKFN